MKYEIFKTEDGSDSVRFVGTDITFHSKNGAVQESQLVFIENGFQYYIQQHPGRKKINIFEVGFGTGLNTLLTAKAAAANSVDVIYQAIDLHPLPIEIYSKLNYPYILNELELYKTIMQTDWNQLLYIGAFLKLKKIKAEFQFYTFNDIFDIIYFDAFAPDDQEEMWGVEIYKKLYDALSAGGVFVTYCSKSAVRKDLEEVGFSVEKLNGPPGKREIIRAVKNKR